MQVTVLLPAPNMSLLSFQKPPKETYKVECWYMECLGLFTSHLGGSLHVFTSLFALAKDSTRRVPQNTLRPNEKTSARANGVAAPRRVLDKPGR